MMRAVSMGQFLESSKKNSQIVQNIPSCDLTLIEISAENPFLVSALKTDIIRVIKNKWFIVSVLLTDTKNFIYTVG
jgi:hypothetical protein